MFFIVTTKTGHEEEEVKANTCTHTLDEQRCDLKRAEFLLREAMSEDEQDNYEQALLLYMESVELCLKAKECTSSEQVKQQLNLLADRALTRAEHLKQITNEKLSNEHQVSSSAQTADEISGQIVSTLNLDEKNTISLPLHSPSTSSSSPSNASISEKRTRKGLIILGPPGYSKEEITVLRQTSIINGREYVPFLSVDLKERFALSIPFTDKAGFLALSEKVN